jgi:THO complex subunit 2
MAWGVLGDGGGADETNTAGNEDETGIPPMAVIDILLKKQVVPPKVEHSQKAGLVEAFMALGDLRNAKKILDRFSTNGVNITDVYPAISDNLCRLMHVAISEIEIPLRPLCEYSKTKPQVNFDHLSPLINCLDPSFCVPPGISFRGRKKFFYDAWDSQITAYKDINDCVKFVKYYLRDIGPHLFRDVSLIGKLIRIAQFHIKNYDTPLIRKDWLQIISNYIFPAIAQMSPNPGILDSLWGLLKLWSFQVRYTLYYEWRTITYNKYPQLIAVNSFCESTCSYIMDRLAKENFKEYGRQIGKMCHSNALIAFSKIIIKIGIMPNLSDHFVDATKNMTEIEFDMLIYSLLEALTDVTQKLDMTGLAMSMKFQSFCKFAGNLISKKPSSDLGGIFQYIQAQVTGNSVEDLLLLQEIIQNMSGIAVLDDTTDMQLATLSGGPILQRIGCGFDPPQKLNRPINHLRINLAPKPISTLPLGLALGIIVSQAFQNLIYRKQSEQIKSLGWLQDNCHKIFLQYFTFIFWQFSNKQYSSMIPSLTTLVTTYGLEIFTAFHILRPKIVNDYWLLKEVEPAEDTAMDIDRPVEALGAYTKMIDDLEKEISMLQLFQNIILSPNFFVTFWQLSIGDIIFPNDQYTTMIENYKKSIAELEKNSKNDKTSKDISKRKSEISTLTDITDKLEKECKLQQEYYQVVNIRIQSSKNTWFLFEDFGNFDVYNQIIQCCILPRCVISPADALFSARFIEKVHSIGTSNFSTLKLLDQIFNYKTLHSFIFSLTELEAKNFGLFFSTLLATLACWHNDRVVFEGNVLTVPGFLRINKSDLSNLAPNQFYDYDDFRKALAKWHSKLMKCFVLCINSGHYLHIRNAIIVMNKIIHTYPATVEHAGLIEAAIKTLENEERHDLKLMSRSYKAALQRCSKKWVVASAFSNLSKPLTLKIDESKSPQIISAYDDPISPPSLSIQVSQIELEREISMKSETENGEIRDYSSQIIENVTLSPHSSMSEVRSVPTESDNRQYSSSSKNNDHDKNQLEMNRKAPFFGTKLDNNTKNHPKNRDDDNRNEDESGQHKSGTDNELKPSLPQPTLEADTGLI